MAVITGEATDVQLGRVNEELIKQLFSKPSKFDGHRFSALCEIARLRSNGRGKLALSSLKFT